MKNTVTVSQEKLLQDTSDRLQQTEKDLHSTQQQLSTKEEQVGHLESDSFFFFIHMFPSSNKDMVVCDWSGPKTSPIETRRKGFL